jgi:hypothetical protein
MIGEGADAPVFMVLTISCSKSGPVMVEFARLFRPCELAEGALPYHASKEVIWSNVVKEVALEDLNSEPIRRISVETRRAFILRSEFPPTAYFFHSPEMYWAEAQPSSSVVNQVGKRPKMIKSSEKRILLPDAAVTRARSRYMTLVDDDTDSNTSPTTYTATELKKTTEMMAPANLTHEDSFLLDLGKSSEFIDSDRKRLRRVASVSERGSSLDFEDSPVLSDKDSFLLPSPHAVAALSSVDNTQESIENPPAVTTTKPKMWTLDDQMPSTGKQALDKDDWVGNQMRKPHSELLTPKKDGSPFRASLSPSSRPDPVSVPRTTQLARNSAHLNNYEVYAVDDDPSGVSANPPSPARSKFSSPNPVKPNNTRTSGITNIDSDDDDFKSHPISTLTPPSASSLPASSEKLPVKAWRPPGPRQTKIGFPKASATNALDSAVTATSSLSPTYVEKVTATQVSSKKKAIRPLNIGGVAPPPKAVDANQMLMDRARSRSKPSPQKLTEEPNQTRKRPREEEIRDEDDEDVQFMAEIGIPATGPYKLRKLAPENEMPQGLPMMRSKVSPNGGEKRKPLVEEDEDGEMDGFIVDDDEEIEMDDKIRFIDEEPMNPDLGGYLIEDSNDAIVGDEKSGRQFFSDLASLDMKTAFMRYLQYLVSSVINASFASTWAGEGSKSDEYFKPALRKVRNLVCSIKDSLISSSVWSTELKREIDIHPVVSTVTDSSKGAVETNCKVCRRNHVSTRLIHLTGPTYDCEAYWDGEWQDNPSETAESELYSFRAGPMCSSRVLCYHQLQHMQYYLVQHIKPRVAKAREQLLRSLPPGGADDEEQIEVSLLELVMGEDAWTHELHLKFDHLIESSLNFGIRSSTKNNHNENDDLLLRYDYLAV